MRPAELCLLLVSAMGAAFDAVESPMQMLKSFGSEWTAVRTVDVAGQIRVDPTYGGKRPSASSSPDSSDEGLS
jgi:hypothetical protein